MSRPVNARRPCGGIRTVLVRFRVARAEPWIIQENALRVSPTGHVLAVWLIASASAGAVLPSCARGAAPKPPAATAAPGLDELMNMKYTGIGSDGGVTLADGRYENEKARRSVSFARGFRVTGDLDGDGRDEAVVLLGESRGGSGTFNYLAIVGRKEGAAVSLATTPLGDRVQVRAARIEKQRLVVDVLRPGAQDAMCCPGELATVAWELKGGRLQPVETGVKPARLSLAALGGTEWVLRSWAWDEPVAQGIEITFEVKGDRIAGRAACNSFFATATARESPGDLALGAAGATKMACPEPQMAAESRFLARLDAVRKYSFVAGQLALSWNEGDKTGTMLFERRAKKK
jgi:heat shock protein HslJ